MPNVHIWSRGCAEGRPRPLESRPFATKGAGSRYEATARILPAAHERGVTEDQIQLMTVENPRRIFEAQGPC